MATLDKAQLEAVDELCHLAVRARRLGCRVLLTDVSPELRTSIVLAGVAHVLLGTEERDLP